MSVAKCTVTLSVVLISVFSAPIWAAPADKPGDKKGPPTVEVITVARDTIARQLNALAILRASESVMLKAEVAGRVLGISFNEGQQVRKGQLLLRLDDDLQRAEQATAQAALELAQAEFNRYQALFKEQQVSALDFERKKAELAQARASMQSVQARLRQKEIHAPFAGVIGLRQFSVGDVVQPGQALVSLSSFNPMKADIRVPETSSGQLRQGQAVSFRVDAVPDLILNGLIQALEPVLESGSRAVLVRAVIPKADPRLKAGMTARAMISLPSDSTIVIPEQALVAQRGKFVVFRVINGQAVATPVEVGTRQAGKVAVLSGLQVNDIIVASGQNKLSKPQMPIKAVPMQGEQ